jgi:pimeloyl-ACP methyl ester carboxylesterase
MGIQSARVQTPRLATHVRTAGDPTDPPLILIHGNVSSGAFFEELMEALARRDVYVVAPDLRGYGKSETKAIDATRGMRDFSDDLHSLIETLGLITPLDLLGWSAGSGVVMQYAIDHGAQVKGLILEAAMSPYGFGGTGGVEGEAVWPDYAGSGGGTANPEFVRLLKEGDRGTANPVSPRNTMRAFYVKPDFQFQPEVEEKLVEAMLATSVGDDAYPGDLVPSDNWPGVAPGRTGMNNAISPRYLDLSQFADLSPAPPVLWIRGDSDQIVSDTSFFDFGYLGSIGAVPGWPGQEVYPVQPMVSQLRAVLARAGNFREVIFENCGHTPHLEHPQRFLEEVLSFLG